MRLEEAEEALLQTVFTKVVRAVLRRLTRDLHGSS